MRHIAIAALSLLPALASIPTEAADLRPAVARPAAQPAAQPAQSNWSGTQVGGHNGVSGVNNNFAEPGAYICPTGFPFGSSCFETPFGFEGHELSYTIGGFIGYRVQAGMYVYGIEGDLSWKRGETSGALTSVTCYGGGVTCRSDYFTGSVEQTWDASIRGRVGYLWTPDTLVYVTGGVAFGEIKGSFAYQGILTGADAGTTSGGGSWNDVRVGWTVGGGVESQLWWPRWKARLEGRWTDFGSYSVTVPLTTVPGIGCCSSPSSAARIDLKESFWTVRVGLGYDL